MEICKLCKTTNLDMTFKNKEMLVDRSSQLSQNMIDTEWHKQPLDELFWYNLGVSYKFWQLAQNTGTMLRLKRKK